MGVYNVGFQALAQGRVTSSGAYTVMLCTTGYTPNQDHVTVDDGTTNDPKSYEVAVVGYSRQTLASVSLTKDNTRECAYLDATDPTFTGLAGGATIGTVCIFPYSTGSTQAGTATTGDTGQVLLSFYDTTDVVTNGSNITFTFSTDGFIYVGTTT